MAKSQKVISMYDRWVDFLNQNLDHKFMSFIVDKAVLFCDRYESHHVKIEVLVFRNYMDGYILAVEDAIWGREYPDPLDKFNLNELKEHVTKNGLMYLVSINETEEIDEDGDTVCFPIQEYSLEFLDTIKHTYKEHPSLLQFLPVIIPIKRG